VCGAIFVVVGYCGFRNRCAALGFCVLGVMCFVVGKFV